MATFIVIIMKQIHATAPHNKNYIIILLFSPSTVKDTYFHCNVNKLSMATHQGGIIMADTIEQRACELAVYITETCATVRTAAKHFGISKSTVHKDLSQRLPYINHQLYLNVRKVLDLNKAERHIRGGIATKEKYKHRT